MIRNIQKILIFWFTQNPSMYSAINGLRTPNEAFFHSNPEFLGLGSQIGQVNFGAFGGIFGQTISTHTMSPLSMGIVNIQAQISGLSFGVARVLFSDFRWYDWCPQVFCFMYSNLKEKWPSWRMEEGLRPILDLYTNKYKQKPNPVKKNGTSESWLWLHFALLWADFLTRFSPVFSWIFWKRFQWNQ